MDGYRHMKRTQNNPQNGLSRRSEAVRHRLYGYKDDTYASEHRIKATSTGEVR